MKLSNLKGNPNRGGTDSATGTPGRSKKLADIANASGMNDSIPTQGQGAPGAVNPMRVAALKKMGKKR